MSYKNVTATVKDGKEYKKDESVIVSHAIRMASDKGDRIIIELAEDKKKGDKINLGVWD